METLIVEAIAYLFVLPLRVVGLIGGRRVRERTRRTEGWILEQAWRVGASGVMHDSNTGRRINEEAHASVWALTVKQQAEVDLERTTPELERGRRRVEGAATGAPRSAQLREAMLEAQRRREAGERRSGRVMLLGVREQFRTREFAHLGVMLTAEIHVRGRARGYDWAELGWVLEGNDLLNSALRRTEAEVYRTYRIYEKGL